MNRVENIVDLPTEIILLIFEYLLPSDRRVASECCRKFLEIWLHNKFIGDRRFVFDFDQVKDPDSILAIMRTQRKYDHIVLSEYGLHFAGEAEFWTKLGETVTKLELYDKNCSEMLRWPDMDFWKMFSNVKTLMIKQLKLPTHFDGLPESIDFISLDGVTATDLERFNVGFLRKKSGPLKLELKDFELDDASSFIKEHHLKIVTIEDDTSRLDQSVKAPNVKHLSLGFYDGNDSFFVNLEEKFPQLQYLELNMTRPPLRNWKFLKSLAISCRVENELPKLAIFENLEELFFVMPMLEECFFVHNPYLIKNLKTLKLGI